MHRQEPNDWGKRKELTHYEKSTKRRGVGLCVAKQFLCTKGDTAIIPVCTNDKEGGNSMQELEC